MKQKLVYMNQRKSCRYCLSNVVWQDMEHFDGELRQCDASGLENLSHAFTTPAHAEPPASGGEIRLSIHSSMCFFQSLQIDLTVCVCACVGVCAYACVCVCMCAFRRWRSIILTCLMTRSSEIRWTCTPSSSHVWARSRCLRQNRSSIYTPDLWDCLSEGQSLMQ